MTDTVWRLSGAIGEPLDPDQIREQRLQVMLQGIGHHLRPVDGTPPEDSGDILGPENVASGLFMQFMPQGWEAGKIHPKGSVVADGTWTMVAERATLESPFPVPVGNAEKPLASWTPGAPQTFAGVVYSGHTYTLNETCWLRSINVYVTQLTADTNYRVVTGYQLPGESVFTFTTLEEPVLAADAWKNISQPNLLLPAGTVVRAYIDGLNSGADQTVTGGWTYTGQSNNTGPAAQAWNHNNANTLLRISKTDLDGTDRTSELEGITVNSTLLFADTNNPAAFNQYRVNSEPPVDQGTYFEYQVVLQEQGEGGVPQGTTTMTATIPIPQPTEYAEVAGVPVYTGPDITVQGYLAQNGTEVPAGQSNSYGIDLEFETTTAPVDWVAFAFNQP